LVKIGSNTIVGNETENIVKEAVKAYHDNVISKKWIDFYDGGRASSKIVEILRSCKTDVMSTQSGPEKSF